MKKLFAILILLAFALNGVAQETHFDFSITNSTGYDMYFRIVDADNNQVEYAYPCQHNDNYWWGYIKPEGKLMLLDTVTYNGTDYTVVAIGDHAFCGCSDLRGELEFPQAISAIGAGAFKGCSNLSGNLNMPAAMTRIEDETFSGCSSFTGKLALPDSVQYVGSKAFLNCSNFRGMMMLPATLTFVGDEAFKGCTNVNSMSVKSTTVPTTAANAFDEIPSWITVNVPYNMKEAYQTASGWSRFANHTIEKSIWTGNAAPWAKGSGTSDDPYLIESAENLAWLAKSVNERRDLVIDTGYSAGGVPFPMYNFYDVYAYQDTCFQVVIDIDLRKSDGLFWPAIGNCHFINGNNFNGPVYAPHHSNDVFGNPEYYFYTYFCGRFDGNNHEISNYSQYADYWEDDQREANYGLFGIINGSVQSNLILKHCAINVQQSGKYIGSLTGQAINSQISNCHASGTLKSGNIADQLDVYSTTAGGLVGLAQSSRIENSSCQADLSIFSSLPENGKKGVGGIIGVIVCNNPTEGQEGIFNCSFIGNIDSRSVTNPNGVAIGGGIVGSCYGPSDGTGKAVIENCFSRGTLHGAGYSWGSTHNISIGGIIGNVEQLDTLRILNCYSNDTITANITATGSYAGGIIGKANALTTLYIKNCYHAGSVEATHNAGILAQNTNMTVVRNCYFEQDCAPDDGFGVPMASDYMKTEAFVNRLNNGSTVYRMDTEPFENNGYPIFGTDGLIFVGAEWYYEIHNNDGTITYQHLQCVGDTTINEERPKIIVRSNTHYDRDTISEVTHEYVYEENGIVYWWNKTLGKFTVLYDFGAEVGDEWTIEVENETITTHVYETEIQYIGGIPYKRLTIVDPNDDFTGSLLSSIGHQTSFFPEKLMSRGKGYRVEGLRCYWLDDELIYKLGDEDCDAIYDE